MWACTISEKDKPLYQAIVTSLERAIESGEVLPGERLPTHRSLAKNLGFTVTTITRAYSEAEKRGLVTAVVGKGTFVTSSAKKRMNSAGETDEVIEMGVASPLYNEDPDVRPIIDRVLQKDDLNTLMKLSLPQGLLEHREIGASWIQRYGLAPDAEAVLITAGPQHSMTSVFHSVFEAGDCIAVDQLTSPAFKSFARRAGLHLEGIPIDEAGMLPEKLEELCERKEVVGVYTAGNAQFPGNTDMSSSRRKELASIIKKHDLVFVEDDSFNFFDTRKSSLISALVPENSIYIASVSAAFYAGLRIAFVTAPERFYSRISQGIADSIWMVSPLCTAIACECIRSGVAERIVREKKKELARRVELCREKLKGYSISCSAFSMFAWLALPDYWTCTSFEYAAEKSGLSVYAAEKFAVGPAPVPNCIRLVLTGPPDIPTFKKGLDILLKVLRRESNYVKPLL